MLYATSFCMSVSFNMVLNLHSEIVEITKSNESTLLHGGCGHRLIVHNPKYVCLYFVTLSNLVYW